MRWKERRRKTQSGCSAFEMIFWKKSMLDKRRPYVLLSQQIIHPGRANGPCKRERRALMINTAITMYGMMMCCSMSLGHGERLRCLQ